MGALGRGTHVRATGGPTPVTGGDTRWKSLGRQGPGLPLLPPGPCCPPLPAGGPSGTSLHSEPQFRFLQDGNYPSANLEELLGEVVT